MFDRTTINITPVIAGPGDTLVVTTSKRLPRDVYKRIQHQLDTQAPGVRMVVLESGVSVEAVIKGDLAGLTWRDPGVSE